MKFAEGTKHLSTGNFVISFCIKKAKKNNELLIYKYNESIQYV